jgi:hypothetical protein
VKGVGEPCAGEPHARFDGRGLETERISVTAPAPDPTRFLILAAVLAPLVIGANLAAARWSDLRWSAGLVTGMVVAMFVIARMSPPPWIENRAGASSMI